jgi:mono/diheme cytochrome c family protein
VKRALYPLLACGALLALSTISSGQKGRKDGKARDVYSELGKAPLKAQNRANPFAEDPEAVAAGRLLFEDHCAECHGDRAAGGRKGPSLRAPEVQDASSGTLFWLLTNGVVRKGMPVWSRLPEPQRWALVRYLKSLGTEEPPVPEASAGSATQKP